MLSPSKAKSKKQQSKAKLRPKRHAVASASIIDVVENDQVAATIISPSEFLITAPPPFAPSFEIAASTFNLKIFGSGGTQHIKLRLPGGGSAVKFSVGLDMTVNSWHSRKRPLFPFPIWFSDSSIQAPIE
ncbi:uncharacterized protein LOC110279895 [Arachis duranensis]|uniref:Uncharacterized protein LOC110279895 n=1 Tax=Arachis duranensis TaxID=130453 RepID=A0A6P5NH09_ARADU|nr:uncharacterized protein LOC110279895 [Arachis duranensis]